MRCERWQKEALFGVGVLVAVSVSALAQVPAPRTRVVSLPPIWQQVTPQERLQVVAIAQADARRALAERVLGFRLDSGMTISDLVHSSSKVDAGLDAVLKRAGETEPPEYRQDGSVMVVHGVRLGDVLGAASGSGQAVVGDRLIEALGCGALPGSKGARLIAAKRAAELDAFSEMAKRVIGVKITSRTTVKDACLANDRITESVTGFLKGIKPTDIVYNDDESCEVTVQLKMREVIETVVSVTRHHGGGDGVSLESMQAVNRDIVDRVLSVKGHGVTGPAQQRSGLPGARAEGNTVTRRAAAAGLAAEAESLPVGGGTAEGIGRANAALPNAREQALTEALRDAVRQGIGVDILSESRVTNFALDFDRVFTHAFGHVRDYRILEQAVDDAGLYTVRVRATVAKGVPGRDDVLALRMLVQLKGSPSVAFETSESIDRVTGAGALTKSIFQTLALDTGLNVIDLAQARSSTARRSRRDKLLGRAQQSAVRDAELVLPYDFLIKSKVNGAHTGTAQLYGTRVQRFSFGADMSAIWPETGETIAQVRIPSTDISSSKRDVTQAARDAMERLLRGKLPVSRDASALTLFNRILMRWVTELDLGSRIRLEFDRLDRASFDAIVQGLRGTPGIGLVSVKSFDPRGFSKVEVESRSKASDLKNTVLALAAGRVRVDRVVSNHLQFVTVTVVPKPEKETAVPPAAEKAAPKPARPVSRPGAQVPVAPSAEQSARDPLPDDQGEKSLPPWIYGAGGAGAVALLWAVYAAGRRQGG
ncbi:MAG: hypothetical protein HN976_44220 [Lentisphaerae bacterium]|nr:hypothetical protein [Lentisphaerota bacterium]